MGTGTEAPAAGSLAGGAELVGTGPDFGCHRGQRTGDVSKRREQRSTHTRECSADCPGTSELEGPG